MFVIVVVVVACPALLQVGWHFSIWLFACRFWTFVVCVRFFRKELSKLKRQQQQQEQEATPARNVLVFIFLFLSFALLYSIPYCNSFAFVSRSFLISFYLQVSSFLFGLSPPSPAYLKFSLSCKLNCTQCFFWRYLNINYALAMH